MDRLPFRQVHLDFHTSEEIPGVGRDWDKGQFQEMLQLGCVNSINLFAKCHHGWSYFPTETPLAAVHPTLTFDLLGAMVEACREIGVKCLAYISVGHDEKLARTHAHWLRRFPDGRTSWAGWMQPCYHEFCLRSPYVDHLIAHTEEVVRRYDIDGIWLDIVGVRECCCPTCLAEYRARGLDPRDEAARRMLGRETYLGYTQRINAAIRASKPELLVFHNAGHITRGDREVAAQNTHLELESLPTGGWGYDHFRLSARYSQGLGLEVIGMTGKFHTQWGEFGGFKHPNALRYESAVTLANGAKICVGDQMHPCGRLDGATYRLIGEAYREVEQKEPWCRDVTSVADVGVLSMEAFSVVATHMDPEHPARLRDTGALRVLQEGGILFDFIDPESDFSRYRVLVLPDAVPVDDALAERLAAYRRGGGRILASGTSALDPQSGEFRCEFGVKHRGVTAFSPEYIVPRFPLTLWDSAPFVLYGPMQDVAVTTGTVLADRQDPYFNRDILHFCSHQHAPSRLQTAGAAMVRTADSVYVAFDAFRQYAEMGQVVLREIILHGLRELLDQPTLVTSLPSQGIQTVMRQEGERRTIVHLVYGSPIRRGKNNEIIEDLVPLHEVSVALRVPARPVRVYLAPQGVDLDFDFDAGVMKAVVPLVACHQMVVVE